MTPDERYRRARSRFLTLSLLRAAGVVVMLFGLGMWFGDVGGLGENFGTMVFLLGLVTGLVVPAVLARRWRSPRE